MIKDSIITRKNSEVYTSPRPAMGERKMIGIYVHYIIDQFIES